MMHREGAAFFFHWLAKTPGVEHLWRLKSKKFSPAYVNHRTFALTLWTLRGYSFVLCSSFCFLPCPALLLARTRRMSFQLAGREDSRILKNLHTGQLALAELQAFCSAELQRIVLYISACGHCLSGLFVSAPKSHAF